jgi:hypothetical protein
MPRRLEDIIGRERNPTKYYPEEQYTQWALFRPKIVKIQSQLNLYLPAVSFYVARTVCSSHADLEQLLHTSKRV